MRIHVEPDQGAYWAVDMDSADPLAVYGTGETEEAAILDLLRKSGMLERVVEDVDG